MLGVAMLLAACGKKKVQPAVIPPPPAPTVSQTPAPPKRQPPRRAATAPKTPASDATTPPALQPYTTPEERSAFTREIDDRVRVAEQNLARLRQRGVSAEEAERVASFVRQARAAQADGDFSSARNFAARAEILSRDLLAR